MLTKRVGSNFNYGDFYAKRGSNPKFKRPDWSLKCSRVCCHRVKSANQISSSVCIRKDLSNFFLFNQREHLR